MSLVSLPFSPTTFACDCIRLSFIGSSCLLLVLYRPGSDHVTSQFFDDLELEFLANQSLPSVLTGDVSVRLDRPADPASVRFKDLLESFVLTQHVTETTHRFGGILDIVVTKSDDTPSSLQFDDIGISDHHLMTWSVNVCKTTAPNYVTCERRLWKNLDVAQFRNALHSLSLCIDDTTGTDLDVNEMASQYSQVIAAILDDLIPVTTKTYRVRQSDPWLDDECRSAKRTARKLERRYKRILKASSRNRPTATSVSASRESWLHALKTSRRLVEQKRKRFWRSQAANSTNPARLWQTFDAFLGRSKVPNSSSFSPQVVYAFFTSRVENVRNMTQSAPPPQYRDVNVTQFSSFDSVTVADVTKLIHDAPNKQSWLDPLPMWLLKECSDLLSPFLSVLCNMSLRTGVVPASFKTAVVTPLIKKSSSDVNTLQN